MGTATLEERIISRRMNIRRAQSLESCKRPLRIVGEQAARATGVNLPDAELRRLANLVAAGRRPAADPEAVQAGRQAAAKLAEQFMPLIRNIATSLRINPSVIPPTDLAAYGIPGFVEGVAHWANTAADAGYPLVPTVSMYVRSRMLRAIARLQTPHLGGYKPAIVEQISPYFAIPEVTGEDITHIFGRRSWGETFESIRSWQVVSASQVASKDDGGVVDGIRHRSLRPGEHDRIIARLEEHAETIDGTGNNGEEVAARVLADFTESEREVTLAWVLDDQVTPKLLGRKSGVHAQSVLRRIRERVEAEFVASLDPATLEDLMAKHGFKPEERVTTRRMAAGRTPAGMTASRCRWEKLIEEAGFRPPTSLAALAA